MMATLSFDRFQCVASMEDGDDSPYFLVFEGDPTRPAAEAELHLYRKPHWDNEVGDNSVFGVHEVVATGVEPGHLVICALIEEDANADLQSYEEFEYVRSRLRADFDAFRNGGKVSRRRLGRKLSNTCHWAISEMRTDDDIVGVGRVPVTTTDGALPTRPFVDNAENAEYRAFFSMA